MILQELVNYYNRKAADPDSGIAPLGWERKEIPYLVAINIDGSFCRLEDTREPSGKKFRPHSFIVPSLGEAKGNGIKANLFWENAEYMFGIPLKDGASEERVKAQHAAFVAKVDSLQKRLADCLPYHAVQAFLHGDHTAEVLNDPLWPTVAKESGPTFLLSVVGSGPITGIELVKKAVSEVTESGGGQVDGCLCMVTGQHDELSRLEPNITGFASTGSHLVSVNNKVTKSGNSGATPAFASFMKEQGANSPIGRKASLAYATALNTLLGKDSRQKLRVGDATVVFWAEKDDSFESAFGSFFEEPPKDNPDALVDSVRALYKSPQTGVCVLDDDKTRFFVLGLAPNSARISVRFWETGTVAELSARFRQYFDDLTVIHGPRDRDHLSLWRLLVSTAQQGKSENVNPNLAGTYMRTVLEGRPFPETLIQAVLVRVRAERDVGYPRAKLIKGYLCRKLNLTTEERNKLVSLNKDNMNIGYRLGRLFASLEKIQNDANPGINATIRDRFYAAASSSPVTVFGNLMRMSNHWLSKVESEKPGLAVVRKKLLGEIIEGMSSFPAHLAIADQGFFALGYYHQQQDFFTKKQSDESEQN